MRYIDKWLTGLGLDYIIPKLLENGISTPKKLAQLSLRDMYEVVGVEDPEDRKKLYFLIQRLQSILNKSSSNQANNLESDEVNEESNDKDNRPFSNKSTSKDQELDNEEDLRGLRKQRRSSIDNSLSSSNENKIIYRSHSIDRDSFVNIPNENILNQQKDYSIIDKKPFSNKSNENITNNNVEFKGKSFNQVPFTRPRTASVDSGLPIYTSDKPQVSPQLVINKIESKSDLHNNIPILDLPIRVVVRKRPLSRQELARGERDVMEIQSNGKVCIHEPKIKVDLTKIVETQSFIFDDSFDSEENNDVIYLRTVKPLVKNIFIGGKATCFAYGQTGSGKTFTMMGNKLESPSESDPAKSGLYVLAAKDIFDILSQPQFKSLKAFVSCFEIYGGKLFDLLKDRGLVRCLEDSKQQVQILGLSEHQVNNVSSLIDLMQVAHNNRSTGATGANSESSRSHLIMQIEIKEMESITNKKTETNRRQSFLPPSNKPKKLKVIGKLTFIDLAGSERGADTTNNSKQTRMEGAEINTSLLALKEVIRSLDKKHGHTPFRGSKLTQVLKDSFIGENTRTCMIACVSPSHGNCEHTLNTLRYADRVKEHQSSNNPNCNQPVIDYNNSDSENMNDINDESYKQPEFPEKAIEVIEVIENKQPIKSNQQQPLQQQVNQPTRNQSISLTSTNGIQMTVNLLTTHKTAIAEMVEVMKEEMLLVQEMENAEERDSEGYVDKLDDILSLKLDGIQSLRNELKQFQNYRNMKYLDNEERNTRSNKPNIPLSKAPSTRRLSVSGGIGSKQRR